MIGKTQLFLIIAVLSGVLGICNILGSASSLAMILSILFMAIFAISFLLDKRPPVM